MDVERKQCVSQQTTAQIIDKSVVKTLKMYSANSCVLFLVINGLNYQPITSQNNPLKLALKTDLCIIYYTAWYRFLK